jgi:hypothetical protein
VALGSFAENVRAKPLQLRYRRSMKSMESRKWGQKDKHQLTAKGDLAGFIARLKSEAARVAAVTKANERRPN